MVDDQPNEDAAVAVTVPDAVMELPQASTNASASASLASLSTTDADVNVSEDVKEEEDDERMKLRAQCVVAFRTGASYREVAEQLQLTIGTVQSHIKQARRLGELGEEAPARAKGRPRLINDAIDAMLVRIIQEKGTKSARLIQEELAKPPHNTKLSYEVVRRRVKQLIDSIAALPHHPHGDADQSDGNQEGKEHEEGSGSLRGYEQAARDLDMLAETVRSIVTNVTQTLDGDDHDGSEENAGEDNGGADANDDNALEVGEEADGEEAQRDPQGLSDKASDQTVFHTASSSGQDLSAGASAAPYTDSTAPVMSAEQQVASGEQRRRSGRPRSMTIDMDETIAAELQADPTVTTRAIHAKLFAKYHNLEVSFETVRRRVQEIRAQRSGASAGEHNILAVEAVDDVPATVAATESAASAAPSTVSPTDPQIPSSSRKTKKGEYSPHTRALCVEKHEVGGMSYASIAKELGIPQDSVRAIIRKAKRTGSVQSAPRSGRPRKTSEIVDRVILQAVRANERSSAKAIQESLLKVFNVKVSSETIRRRVLANTRQRLLAISSGDDASASNPDLRSLDEDAAAAAVASALAAHGNERQSLATTKTPTANQQAQPDDTSSAPTSSPSNPLAASSEIESEPDPNRPAPPVSPSTRATGEKRRLDASAPSSVPMQQAAAAEAAQGVALAGPAKEEQQSQPQQPKKKRAKRREYSVELREKCVAMHEQGEGYRRIGQALGMPHTTVRAIVEKVTRTGSVLPAPRSGRPRKTDEIVDRVILEAVRNNEKCSARMIQEELLRGYGVRISCETIRRRVKDHSRQSLARGETLSPATTSESHAQSTSVQVANQSAGGALSGASGAQPLIEMIPMSSLPAFPTQPQQQQPVQEDQMLQLLPMQSVSDDDNSVVL